MPEKDQKTEFQRFDETVRKMLSVSKEELKPQPVSAAAGWDVPVGEPFMRPVQS